MHRGKVPTTVGASNGPSVVPRNARPISAPSAGPLPRGPATSNKCASDCGNQSTPVRPAPRQRRGYPRPPDQSRVLPSATLSTGVAAGRAESASSGTVPGWSRSTRGKRLLLLACWNCRLIRTAGAVARSHRRDTRPTTESVRRTGAGTRYCKYAAQSRPLGRSARGAEATARTTPPSGSACREAWPEARRVQLVLGPGKVGAPFSHAQLTQFVSLRRAWGPACEEGAGGLGEGRDSATVPPDGTLGRGISRAPPRCLDQGGGIACHQQSVAAPDGQ